MTLRAYFDGKVIVPRQPVDLPVGQDMVLTIEPVESTETTEAKDLFAPLTFRIDPATSRRIAEDPQYSIENS